MRDERAGFGRRFRWAQGLYLVGIGGCVYMLYLAAETVIRHPGKGLAAAAGLLFFASGAIGLVVVWRLERLDASQRQSRARLTYILGVCTLLLGLSGILFAFLDPVAGVLAAVLGISGGVVLLNRARRLGGGG